MVCYVMIWYGMMWYVKVGCRKAEVEPILTWHYNCPSSTLTSPEGGYPDVVLCSEGVAGCGMLC